MRALQPIPFGAALGIALAILSILCWLAVLVFPTTPLAHNWLGLFSTAPVASVQAGLTAIIVSLIAGLFTGAVTASVYNRLLGRAE